MIDVSCRTNIDKFKGLTWPDKMIDRPMKGDMVQATNRTVLMIVDITHCISKPSALNGNRTEYYLEIELHTRNGHVPQ